jgi:AcrR family transcriptional regulator
MTSSASRPPRRDAVDNRAALLEAARVVFSRDPDASLDAVAAEAGLSRRSVYGHFANRDELQREVVGLGSRRIADALEAITHPDPVVRLALIGAGIWREVEAFRMMALTALRGSLRPSTTAGLAPARARVLEAVREAVATGGVRDDIPVERLARLVEDAALAVLEESTRSDLSVRDGHRLVMLNVLGVLGLGWRDAGALIDSHAELAWKELS